MVERNAGVAEDRRIEFRIGIHVGDVVEESDGDLMGDGVNIAARLEGICEPGGDLSFRRRLSACERDSTKESSSISAKRELKNIAEPMRVYARRSASPSRPRLPLAKNRARRASPSSSCPSPTSAAIPSRTTSSTASPRA